MWPHKTCSRRRENAKSQVAGPKDVDATLSGEKDGQNAVLSRVGDLGHRTDRGLKIACHIEKEEVACLG